MFTINAYRHLFVVEVSQLLYNFVQLLHQGNSTVFETELNKLPPTNNWLIKNVTQRAVQVSLHFLTLHQ